MDETKDPAPEAPIVDPVTPPAAEEAPLTPPVPAAPPQYQFHEDSGINGKFFFKGQTYELSPAEFDVLHNACSLVASEG